MRVGAGAMTVELEFSVGTARSLAEADTICRNRGARLTDLRRQVLGLVLESAKPAGAYDLLEKLRAHHKGAAPPTVYRALDFLLEQGLIHKVERLSAFVGCVHGGTPDHGCARGEHLHAVQFLICNRCDQVTELSDPEIGRALARAAKAHGFAVTRSTIEADGVCGRCAEAAVR